MEGNNEKYDQNFDEFAIKRSNRKNLVISSIVSTEDSIYSNHEADRILRKQKSSLLKATIQQKLNDMKLICQKVKSQTISQKTPDNMQIVPNFSKEKSSPGDFLKLKPERNTQSSENSENNQKRKEFNLTKPFKGFLRIPEQINSLKEVREIDSFMQDEDDAQQISFVQEHGNAVLNWGLCTGKAKEFRVLSYIDEGIYGKVYLAKSYRNGAVYSIKSIYRSKMGSGEIQQLIREVKVQSFLNHPHIVHLYHFFVDQECAYLILQACLGKNLYQNLKEVGKFGEKTVRQYVRQICQGVEYMHRNNILHRDLKPENILLHQNCIKICDFGWAVHSPLLRGTQCGTPLYTSPEIVNKIPYDSKIDIWSIGILTYQMLYGTIPFEIRNNNDMIKIVEQQVYFAKGTHVSEAAKDFINLCLNKNPQDRPSARQLLEHEFLKNKHLYRSTVS